MLHLDKIRELKPDLIIANHEENEKEQIEVLQKDFKVHITDVRDLNDAYLMIQEIGQLTNRKAKANELVERIQQEFDKLPKAKKPKKVLYLIWQKPYMSVGKDTFIHDMIERCGWKNCMQHTERYPEVTMGDMRQMQPDLILLSSEPFPFKEEHQTALQKQVPNSKVILVDGEMFSWYGSRLLLAVDYFRELLEEDR